MPFMESDIDAMLSDSTDIFSAGAVVDQPCIVLENDTSNPMGKTGAGSMLKVAKVLIKASAFPALKVGDSVSLNASPFKAKSVNLIQDGAMLEVMLGQ